MAPGFFQFRGKNSSSPLGLKRIGAFLLALALTVSAVTLTSLGLGAEKAEARFATGGSSDYTGMIDWFEWNSTAGANIPNNTTKSNSRTVGGKTLVTTCTLSGLSGSISAYRPGSWTGDALDDMYNIGGTGTSNQLISGISHPVDGALVSFNINCSATLGGVAVSLPGLVIADAEQSAGTAEYIEAAPLTNTSSSTWRIIDRHRSNSCVNSTNATIDNTNKSNNPNRLRLNTISNTTSPCASGPAAVAFLDGSTRAAITMKGGGKSALALGVMFSSDFGDAPSSYGEAGAGFAASWTDSTPLNKGNADATGSTNVFANGFNTATLAPPATRLGATIDSDATYQASADASLDDTTGVDDEDSIVPPQISVVPGGSYTLPPVACTGPGWVAGWIDWNRNGTFDAGERSNTVQCTGSSVNLSWPTVPANTVLSSGAVKTFMRLRIAAQQSEIASPTGFATNGEVEDYAVNVVIPNLKMEKSSTATANTRPGDTVTYTVKATNVGATAFTSNYPAVFSDDLSGVLDDASYQNNAAVSPVTGALSYSQPKIRWQGVLAVNASVTLTYSVVVGSSGNGTMRNVAFQDTVAGISTPACSPANNTSDGTFGRVACAVVETLLPRLTISKTASSSSLPMIGATLSYTVTVTNPGPGSFTAAAPARFSDDLTDVLDDGTLGTPSSTTGSATVSGNQLQWTGALAANQSATITYTLTYNGTGNKNLVNKACLPASLTVPGAQPCSNVTVPAAAVTTKKSATPASTTAVNPGQTVNFTLSFTNSGLAPGTVDSSDSMAGLLDDATFNQASLAATGGLTASYGVASQSIAVTGTLAPGASATVSYSVTVKTSGFGDARLLNFLTDGGMTSPLTCVASNPNCTVHPVNGMWSLNKTAVPVSNSYVSPGDTIVYTVTASQVGGAINGAVISDSLANVTPGATFLAGSATLKVGTAAPVPVADPSAGNPNLLQTQAFTLGIGQSATLSYSVTVKADAWSKQISNLVSGTSSGAAATCSTTCQTLHKVTAKVLIDKIGESSSATWVPMDGSTWTLNSDSAGSIGAPLPSPTVVKVAETTGRFSVSALQPGSYWLTETTAPAGFNLLAQPVRFTVNDAGAVTIGSGNGNGVVTSSLISQGADTGRGLITVKDVPALKIPEAGGTGTLPFTVVGGLLLAAAALLGFRNFSGRRRA